jgi:hypothetical protein
LARGEPRAGGGGSQEVRGRDQPSGRILDRIRCRVAAWPHDISRQTLSERVQGWVSCIAPHPARVAQRLRKPADLRAPQHARGRCSSRPQAEHLLDIDGACSRSSIPPDDTRPSTQIREPRPAIGDGGLPADCPARAAGRRRARACYRGRWRVAGLSRRALCRTRTGDPFLTMERRLSFRGRKRRRSAIGWFLAGVGNPAWTAGVPPGRPHEDEPVRGRACSAAVGGMRQRVVRHKQSRSHSAACPGTKE